MRKQTTIGKRSKWIPLVTVSTPGTPSYKTGGYWSKSCVKLVQKCPAFRKGVSAMGTKYQKGDEIVHLSSARSTREVYILTSGDLMKIFVAQQSDYRPYKPRKPKK